MARKTTRPEKEASGSITIKKYANRRLYNTAESSYVTLDDLATMVQKGVEFTVHDAKTGDDITRAVLTQIIVEQEAKGNNLLPTGFLRQLISYYGDNLQGLVPQYLDMTKEHGHLRKCDEHDDAVSAAGQRRGAVLRCRGRKGGGIRPRCRDRHAEGAA